VTCGDGNDVVVADGDDTLSVDCESILVGRSGGPQLVLDMAPRGPGATGPPS
jgi:hypothetical protein